MGRVFGGFCRQYKTGCRRLFQIRVCKPHRFHVRHFIQLQKHLQHDGKLHFVIDAHEFFQVAEAAATLAGNAGFKPLTRSI